MRIVAWNIRAGGGRRVEGIARQLARWAPDVVALCEYRATAPSIQLAAALAAQGLSHQLSTADVRRPGVNALLVGARWPLARVRLRVAPIEPRRWLAARVLAPEPVTLGVMHVPNRAGGRKYPFLDAALLCATRWRRGPGVFIGDTNSGRRGLDEEVPAFNAREEGWIDGLSACGWLDVFRHLRGDARAYTWYSPSLQNGFRIDQAFVNRALLPRVKDACYVWGRNQSWRPGRAPCLPRHAERPRRVAPRSRRSILSDPVTSPAPGGRAWQANPRLLVALAGLRFVLFPIPTFTLFWMDHIGMSLTDIMVLQAVFGVSVVLLEFPSGYFADRVGHRRSLLVGAILWGAGWLIYTRGASFADVVVAEMVLGAGIAFLSGADHALLWISLDAAGRSDEYMWWEGRARAAGQSSEALSAAAGGWLYSVGPRLPVWFQVPIAALALGTVVALREVPRSQPAAHRSHRRRALHVVRFALWRHRRLRATMALAVALGLSTFVMVWLIQPYLRTRGIPPAWFGPIWSLAHIWLVAVSLASARVVGALGTRGVLLACCLLVPAGYLGLAATPSAWGAVFYLCFMTLRGLQGPILVTIMQEDAPGEDRASVLSLHALLFRLAFVLVGPPVGMLVDRAGMETTLVVLAVVFTAAGFAALGTFTRARA